MKDWTGTKKGVFTTLGASNHTGHDRAKEDYYATEPKALELLLEKETFSKNIWENACGGCHLANLLRDKGYNVRATDLVDRGGGTDYIYDFLLPRLEEFDGL